MAESLIPVREIGDSGIGVSILGLGTVKIGRNKNVKNKSPDGFKLPEDAEVLNLLDICIEHGVNLLDTAPAYGIAEEKLGKVLKNKRKKFFLSTKAGEEFDGENSHYDFSKKHITESVERSLSRLNTDYLDAVLLHCSREDLNEVKNSAALETLSRLKESGKIRLYGASTHTIEGGEFALQYGDLIMLPFNPEYQEHLPLIQKAKELKKGVFIKKGLLSGHIDEIKPEESLLKCFKEAYQYDSVSSLIAGTINPLHLKQNITLAAKAI